MAIKKRINVLIGVNVQCAMYPIIHSLLAEESGINVQTADIAEAIIPANSIINNSHLIDDLAIFEIFIFNGNYSFYFKRFASKF